MFFLSRICYIVTEIQFNIIISLEFSCYDSKKLFTFTLFIHKSSTRQNVKSPNVYKKTF